MPELMPAGMAAAQTYCAFWVPPALFGACGMTLVPVVGVLEPTPTV